MAFEELDPEIAAFFNNRGELPANTAEEDVPAAAAETSTDAADDATESGVAEHHVEIPDPAAQSIVAPAPVAPPSNPYLERLLEETSARTKQLEAQAAELRAKLEEKAAPVAPDPTVDPLGYLAFKIDENAKLTKQLQEQIAAQQQTTTADTQINKFIQTVEAQVADFMKSHQDYPKAYEHLVNLRMEEYALRGMTKKQADEALNQEQTQITQAALSSGHNVGEVVYALAQKYGYKPQTTTAVVPPKSKLDALKEGIETGTPVERGTPPTHVSVDNLKNMTEREINEVVADEDKWAKLMGHKHGKAV